MTMQLSRGLEGHCVKTRTKPCRNLHYHAGVDIHRIEIPDHIELTTGKVTCRTKKVFRIEIRFQGSEIRRG